MCWSLISEAVGKMDCRTISSLVQLNSTGKSSA